MRKKRYVKKIGIVIVITFIITFIMLLFLNNKTYMSLEDNLKENIVKSDMQRADVLIKQINVFFSTMEGFVTSINQMSNNLEKDRVKLKILLSDLTKNLNASGMGIVDEKGKGLVGVDLDISQYKVFKKSISGENTISIVDKGPGGESRCLLITVPLVDDQNEKKYILYATIVREYVYDVFKTESDYNDQNVLLINRDQEVIIPMRDLEKQNLVKSIVKNPVKYDLKKEMQYLANNILKNRNCIKKVNIKGYGEYYINIVFVKETDMYLMSLINAKEAGAFINYETKTAGIIFGIMAVLFCAAIIVTVVLQFRNQDRMFKLAYTDKLTGIYNWELLQISMSKLLKDNKPLALVIFDIKGLKYINDLYGFETGDRLLKSIANEIKVNKFTENKYYGYARLDGDAFALVIESKVDKGLKTLVKAYVHELQGKLSGIADVDFSVGITKIEKSDDGNYQRAIDNAYSALNSLKEQAGITIGVYDKILKDEIVRCKRLENDLPNAIKNKELKVYLQPKYNAKTEKIVGAEALVRWQHNEFGFISPGQFIPLFERNGMISKVDKYVLEEVCMNLKKWKNGGLLVHPISVNLSRAEVNDKNLVTTVKWIRDKYEIDADLVEIEITESSMANNEEQLCGIMEQLREEGFLLAMDDFGTGYSSLSQLMKMPIDYLKLDKSFIDNCTSGDTNNKSHKFMANIIRIAKDIECTVVAEGVETAEQRKMVMDAGCEIIQGFYYARPMPVDEYEELLKKEIV